MSCVYGGWAAQCFEGSIFFYSYFILLFLFPLPLSPLSLPLLSWKERYFCLNLNNFGSNQVERKPHKLCPYHTITIPPNKNWVWNLCLTVYCTLNTYNCQIRMISVPLYIMDYLAYCLLRLTFINTYQLYYYLHILTHSSSSELELEQVHSHLPRRSSHLLTTSPSSLSSPPHHHHHNHHHHHIHIHNDHERSLWLSLSL